MANQSQHAGTIADPIPQRLLYKKGDKVYTVATGPSTSGPTTDVVEATDTRKGITRLSDAIDSDSNAATGVTAATPLAVKLVSDKVTAVEEKNAEQDQRLTAIENKNLDTDKKLTGIEETLTDHAGRIDALENAGGGSTIVLVPRITSPAQNEVNVLTTFTITGSPYQTLLEGDKRKHRVFELSKSKSFDSLVWTKSVDADSAEVTPPVDESTDFYIRIKDESKQGYVSPWSTVTKITSGGPTKVSNPTVSISGDAQAAKANPTFTGSEFAIEPSDQNDPSEHVSTTWTLRKIDGNLLVWQSTDDIINKTSLTLSVGTLNVSTKYKMEMQYTSKSHGSSAVATVEFTTAAEFTKVKTPTVSIEGGADTVYETPVIKGGAFATTVVDDVDTHKSSTWWITKKVGGAEVFRLDNSTDALTSVTVPKGKLEVSTQYVAHVIYTGTTYGASAEATLEFTTADEFIHIKTPTISIDGGTTAVTAAPVIRGSAFTIEPASNSDTHVSSTWWITRKSGEEVYRLDNNTSSLTILNVPVGTLTESQQYSVHLQYNGKNFGSSKEATLEFTTADKFVGPKPPTLTPDSSGDVDLERYQIGMAFEASDLINIDDSDITSSYAEEADWVLYEGDAEVWAQRNTKLIKFLTMFVGGTPDNFQLKPSTRYKLTYRHKNSKGQWSGWSETYFTTVDELIYPCIHFKVSGQQVRIASMFVEGEFDPEDYDFYLNGSLSEQLKSNYNQDFYEPVGSGEFNYMEIKLVRKSKPYEYPTIKRSQQGASYSPLPYMKNLLQVSSDTIGLSVIGGRDKDTFKYNQQITQAHSIHKWGNVSDIPEDLFKYNQNLTTVTNLFEYAVLSVNIPSGLFRYNFFLYQVSKLLYGARVNGMTEFTIPKDLFAHNISLTSIGNLFEQVDAKLVLDEDMFKNNVNIKYAGGCFAYNDVRLNIPVNLFKPLVNLKGVSDCFRSSLQITPVCRFSARNITQDGVNNFAYNAASTGTVYVPRGSQTAASFRNAYDVNVNVIEE